MKYLNLSREFQHRETTEENELEYRLVGFSGGEPHITIEDNINFDNDEVTITCSIEDGNSLLILLIAVDALRRCGYPLITLWLPYFPGGRQDRVSNRGEALTVKVYADLINDCMFTEVYILDPHSDVTSALLNDCVVINNHEFVHTSIMDLGIDAYHLISPDAGANKKIKDLAKFLEATSVIKCDKTREPLTGELKGFEVYAEDLKQMPCIIVDDICDGGGTFIGLAKELKAKNAGKLYLVVTHGIFSKGLSELSKHFTCIYTTTSIRDNVSTDKLVYINI